MAKDDKSLPDQYKNLRDEQSRLEGQRMNILISSTSITAISAVISQITKDPLLQLILQILLLISLIWGLSMYKSLSSQIFKTITYNIIYLENGLDNKWLQDSMTFADKYPPIGKKLKKWTHIFTLLSALSFLLTVFVFRTAILFDKSLIEAKTHVSIWWYLAPLAIIQVIEVIMCFIGVFQYDQYSSYLKKWRTIKSIAPKTE